MKNLVDVEALKSVDAKFSMYGDPEGDCVLVDWQPGNMTRYEVMFTRLSSGQAKALGHLEGAVLVSLIRDGDGGRSYAFGGNDLVHVTYVADKFNLRYEGCTFAMTALINIALPQCMTKYGVECLDRACNRAA